MSRTRTLALTLLGRMKGGIGIGFGGLYQEGWVRFRGPTYLGLNEPKTSTPGSRLSREAYEAAIPFPESPTATG